MQGRGPVHLPSRRTTLATLGSGLVLLSDAPVAAADGFGRVARLAGDLSAIRDTTIVGLMPGDPVLIDDILRTGPGSRAVIVGADGLRIAIGPGTEMVLRSLAADSGGTSVVLGLLRGITRLIGGVVAGRRTIEIDTRTAVASVRSTEWLVESTGKGTGVLSISGAVTVRSLAGVVVVLQPGEGTDVAPGSPPRPPAIWGAARREDAIARTTL